MLLPLDHGELAHVVLLHERQRLGVTEAQLAAAAESDPLWNLVMAAVILAMLPPVLVVIFMQRLFVKGLVETEK